MTEVPHDEEPVIVTRDAGYDKLEFISPENRKKARERVLNPNIVTGRHKLKELLLEIGIVFNHDALTFIYKIKK